MTDDQIMDLAQKHGLTGPERASKDDLLYFAWDIESASLPAYSVLRKLHVSWTGLADHAGYTPAMVALSKEVEQIIGRTV